MEAPQPPTEVAEAPQPHLPVPLVVDSIPEFMVDCHGEEWLKDDIATMRDMTGPYYYQSWSIKKPTDSTWIEDTTLIEIILAGFVLNYVPPKAADFNYKLYK